MEWGGGWRVGLDGVSMYVIMGVGWCMRALMYGSWSAIVGVSVAHRVVGVVLISCIGFVLHLLPGVRSL